MAAPTKDIFSREGQAIIDNIRALLSQSDANATGKTAASLELTATDNRLLITGGASFGLNSREVGYVAGGRAAGGVPPFRALADWAVARGLVTDPEREKKRINALRFAIAKRGTALYRRNTTRDIYQSVITDEKTEDIIDQVQGVYAQNILSEVVKSFA